MTQEKIILFDIGGVLIDLGGMPKFVEWTGMTPHDIMAQWLMSPGVRAFESGQIGFTAFHHSFVDEWQMEMTEDALYSFFASWVKQTKPGAIALLDELRGRYTLACLTNTNAVHWPVVQATIETDKNFTHQFVSHLLGKLKPDAEMYEHVIEALGVSAENIIFFDDSAKNVAGAQRFGIQAYQVNTPHDVRRILIEKQML